MRILSVLLGSLFVLGFGISFWQAIVVTVIGVVISFALCGVIAIAKAAGYGSVAAFTRAFQSAYGTPPASYRQRGFLVMDYSESIPASRNVKPEHAMFNVTIRESQPVRLAAFRHQGHYLEIGPVFERLFTWAGPRGLMGPTTRGIGIYYTDTHSTPPAAWRSDACISIAADVTPPDDAEAPRLIDLAGGKHAVLRHKGPYAELDADGRYRVRFLFDAGDAGDGQASRLCRMAQPHGGSVEGFHFPLRKGTEVMIAFLGVVVGGIVIAMYLPIFDLISKLT